MASAKPTKRIVIKIGSSLLANSKKLTLRFAFMHGLLSDIAELREQGYQVILTSSGSVALGLNTIGTSPEEAGVLDKQAAAACGQPLLINAYRQVASEHDMEIAQVLVTVSDMEERRRFLNIKNTLVRLFERDVLPIVNENDTITTEELRVGDNDRLAAKVAEMVNADHLIILTSVDGLYDRDPSEAGANFVDTIDDVSEYLEVTSGTSSLGSGGMLTKMHAASLAQTAGCSTLIAKGIIDQPISSILSNERRHTRCVANDRKSSSLAIWVTNRLQMAGSLIVKQSVAETLVKGEKNIDRSDIIAMHGTFQKGDVLHIYDEKENEVVRGLSNFSTDEILLLTRQPDEEVEKLLGYKTRAHIMSHDNMVVLEEHHLQWDAPNDDANEGLVRSSLPGS